jgi:hypothetical protein
MRPEALIVAKWWRSRLTDDTFDNGDESALGILTQMMAKDVKRIQPIITTEQANIFEKSVAESVDQMIEKNGRYHQLIGVDYYPDKVLSEALEKAERPVSITVLPWKTRTSFTEGLAEAAIGYGNPFKQIYPIEM